MPAWIALALVAAAPGPSDVSATYRVPGIETQLGARVDVARDGKSRVDLGPLSFISRDGHVYFVLQSPEKTLVADVADVQAVTREAYAQGGGNVCAGFAQLKTDVTMVQRGTASVGVRSGDAWFKQAAGGGRADKPEVIISHDPALAPIGRALAEQYRFSMSLLPDCPYFKTLNAPMQTALDTGAPLAFSGMELTELREGAVDAQRFELPAPPVPLDALRKMQTGPKVGEGTPRPVN
jgi:hypothetical protein